MTDELDVLMKPRGQTVPELEQDLRLYMEKKAKRGEWEEHDDSGHRGEEKPDRGGDFEMCETRDAHGDLLVGRFRYPVKICPARWFRRM